ncbi:MAG: GNAT family N-acetyltransferase [Patescibacteria group bacterium]|jgi:ribosomal protein S18 acetylase RimI-like enzyme
MNIKAYKRRPKEATNFKYKEWAKMDIELYGSKIGWYNEVRYIVARDDRGDVIGDLELKVEAQVAYIDTLIVRADVRKQGVGRELVREAERVAKELKAHKIYLLTGRNWQSQNFYRSLGYEKTGEQNDHYFHVDFDILTKKI